MLFHVVIHKEGVGDSERTVEAPSRFAIYADVEKEGASVVDITEARSSRMAPLLSSLFQGSVKKPMVGRMATNLATMLTAGLSLSRALSVIERESPSERFKKVVADLASIVEKGTPFNTALEGYPRVFPQVLVAMVRVGEESGTLADSLHIVGQQIERSEELSRKVKGALIYPAIVLVAIIVVSILMLLYVVPTLTATFLELHVELPLATRVFVAVSDFMTAHLSLVVIGLLAIVGATASALHTTAGRLHLIRLGLTIPVVGELIRETYAARTARTLSSLLSAGVPVLEALAITGDVVQVPTFRAVIDTAKDYVKRGEPLSKAFSEQVGTYPVLMSEMLGVGEETGKVAPMLKEAAEFYEADVSERTKDLSTIIEPLLMLLIGAVVGIFAVSMIAPIYAISSAI